MLDNHHRAVYRAHSSLQAQVGNHRVYYAVSEGEEGEYSVVATTCAPTAPKRELASYLAPQLPPKPQPQFFAARGNEIVRLYDARGRIDDSSHTYHALVRLDCALPQAA